MICLNFFIRSGKDDADEDGSMPITPLTEVMGVAVVSIKESGIEVKITAIVVLASSLQVLG